MVRNEANIAGMNVLYHPSERTGRKVFGVAA
jgi:hypothetical protein